MPFELIEYAIRLALILIPLYLANASAMLFGAGTPLDLNKKFFDKKPLFGKGKTYRGTLIGIIVGVLAAIILNQAFFKESLLISKNYLLYGILLSLGAIIGDIVASFIKRRVSIEKGKPAFLLDQLDFVAGGLILGAIIFIPTIEEIAFIVIATLIVHKIANFIAFKWKLKGVPW